MTEYPVQCFEHNGEPYGRYSNPIDLIKDVPFSFDPEEEQKLMLKQQREHDEFEFFAKENTFPFPSGAIGKTYERDEVEVVWQQNFPWEDKSSWEYCENPTELTPDHLDSGMKFRQIFSILPKPVETEPDVISISQMNEAFDKALWYKEEVEKEPETVEEASEKEMNRQSYNYTVPETDVFAWEVGKNAFIAGWIACKDWQKKQEASR